jgi:hypothetical protein
MDAHQPISRRGTDGGLDDNEECLVDTARGRAIERDAKQETAPAKNRVG